MPSSSPGESKELQMLQAIAASPIQEFALRLMAALVTERLGRDTLLRSREPFPRVWMLTS